MGDMNNEPKTYPIDKSNGGYKMNNIEERMLKEHGPVIEKMKTDLANDHDDLLVCKEKVAEIETRIKEIYKMACSVDSDHSKDHDLLNSLIADFTTVKENQKVIINSINTMQLAAQATQLALSNTINLTPRLDALEKNNAVRNGQRRADIAESRSFVQRNINAIIVTGILGAVIMVMFYLIR